MNEKSMATHTGMAIVGGLIVGLAVATYFLYVSNNTLQERVDELEVRRDVLAGEQEEALAESIRLKEEATKNGVFLPK